jgi:hypothetical protein
MVMVMCGLEEAATHMKKGFSDFSKKKGFVRRSDPEIICTAVRRFEGTATHTCAC